MRALCSTFLDIGDKNIPVKVYNRVKSSYNSTGLSQACPKCEGDVGRKNVCKDCSVELESSEIQKKYKVSKTEHVIISEEHVKALKEIDNIIEVKKISSEKIPHTVYSDSYFLLPDTKINKLKTAYAQFTKAIDEIDDTILCTFALRGKERTGFLCVEDNVMIIQALAYSEDLNSVDEKPDLSVATPDKVTKAVDFIKKNIPKGKLSEFKNEYAEKLEKIVQGEDVSSGKKPEEAKDEGDFFE